MLDQCIAYYHRLLARLFGYEPAKASIHATFYPFIGPSNFKKLSMSRMDSSCLNMKRTALSYSV